MWWNNCQDMFISRIDTCQRQLCTEWVVTLMTDAATFVLTTSEHLATEHCTRRTTTITALTHNRPQHHTTTTTTTTTTHLAREHCTRRTTTITALTHNRPHHHTSQFENGQFYLPHRHLMPLLEGTPQNFGMKLAAKKLEGWGYCMVKILWS